MREASVRFREQHRQNLEFHLRLAIAQPIVYFRSPVSISTRSEMTRTKLIGWNRSKVRISKEEDMAISKKRNMAVTLLSCWPKGVSASSKLNELSAQEEFAICSSTFGKGIVPWCGYR